MSVYQFFFFRQKTAYEVRISDWSSDVCSSDRPAAQLVQLGKAEHVGAVDDDGVGARDVEAGLHDVGRQQDVEATVGEGGHHVLQLGRRHAPVGERKSVV